MFLIVNNIFSCLDFIYKYNSIMLALMCTFFLIFSEIMDGQVTNISSNNVIENVGIMIDIHE